MNFMEQQKQRLKLLRLMLLTGLAFMIGGFLRTLLEWFLSQAAEGENGLQIFLAIWLGFIMEATVGMAVLSYLLRRFYPFRKLWLAGTGAFALGILIPALLINQFFYLLLILPGFLVGLFFGLLLRERAGRGKLMLLTTLGFLVCQVLVYSVRNDMPWVIWLYKNAGSFSVTILMHMAQNMIIGIFIALGVGLMLRSSNKNCH
jgi:hypothetical protein